MKYSYVGYKDGLRFQSESKSQLTPKYRPIVSIFDFDGVTREGNHPSPGDIIVTGRTMEEAPIVYAYLRANGLGDTPVYFNPIMLKDRQNHNDFAKSKSGNHKAKIIQLLKDNGVNIGKMHEDDPLQAGIIKNRHPDIEIVKYPYDDKNNADE